MITGRAAIKQRLRKVSGGRERMKRKRKSKFLEIAEVPSLMVVLFLFCYQVVYRWFIVFQWERMNVVLKIALSILFAVMIGGLIVRIIQQILFLKKHLKELS